MSSMDDALDREADLAAIALIRLAIEHRDIAGGSVMETITPYLEKFQAQAEQVSEDGSVNIAPAIVRLLANLSQLAGATFEAFVQERSGGVRPTKEQLSDRLGQYEVATLARTEGGGKDAGEERG